MNYIVYNTETGKIISRGSCVKEDLQLQKYGDDPQKVMEGTADDRFYQVDLATEEIKLIPNIKENLIKLQEFEDKRKEENTKKELEFVEKLQRIKSGLYGEDSMNILAEGILKLMNKES